MTQHLPAVEPGHLDVSDEIRYPFAGGLHARLARVGGRDLEAACGGDVLGEELAQLGRVVDEEDVLLEGGALGRNLLLQRARQERGRSWLGGKPRVALEAPGALLEPDHLVERFNPLDGAEATAETSLPSWKMARPSNGVPGLSRGIPAAPAALIDAEQVLATPLHQRGAAARDAGRDGSFHARGEPVAEGSEHHFGGAAPHRMQHLADRRAGHHQRHGEAGEWLEGLEALDKLGRGRGGEDPRNDDQVWGMRERVTDEPCGLRDGVDLEAAGLERGTKVEERVPVIDQQQALLSKDQSRPY